MSRNHDPIKGDGSDRRLIDEDASPLHFKLDSEKKHQIPPSPNGNHSPNGIHSPARSKKRIIFEKFEKYCLLDLDIPLDDTPKPYQRRSILGIKRAGTILFRNEDNGIDFLIGNSEKSLAILPTGGVV